jgi:galactoside O-acetyltransferase
MLSNEGYYTEHDLADFGFASLGTNVRISSDARVYGAERISIGNDVRIDDFVMLATGEGSITIGNSVYIARCCNLTGTFGIELCDYSSMAANTVIYSASDDYSGEFMTAQAIPKEFTKFVGGKVTIGRHVIIGASSVIIGKADIGEGCSLGAVTVVVDQDLDPWGMYVGNPARRVKERKRDLLELEKQLDARRDAPGSD